MVGHVQPGRRPPRRACPARLGRGEGADAGLRLYQFLRYAIEVYGIGHILTRVGDRRHDPGVPTYPVLLSLLMAAVLRVPSINQLEVLLQRGEFQRLLGERRKKRAWLRVVSAAPRPGKESPHHIHNTRSATAADHQDVVCSPISSLWAGLTRPPLARAQAEALARRNVKHRLSPGNRYSFDLFLEDQACQLTQRLR